MIAIIFSVCFTLSPHNCKAVKLTYADAVPLTPFYCMRMGQTEAAKWVVEHPDWRMKGGPVRCEKVGQFAKA